MSSPQAVDANVIIHFFRDDHPRLSPQTKKLFQQAEAGTVTIYVDEMIVAETIWVMGSYYKISKERIVSHLEALLSNTWVINPRKNLLLTSLSHYARYNLDYVDCWLMVVAKSENLTLTTFDNKLSKLSRSL